MNDSMDKATTYVVKELKSALWHVGYHERSLATAYEKLAAVKAMLQRGGYQLDMTSIEAAVAEKLKDTFNNEDDE